MEVDRVYSMDTWMQVTVDGGATFNNVGENFKHVDNHALWIDPEDPRHLRAGCDGGVYETFDRGATWVYFELEVDQTLDRLELVNRILLDVMEEQSNLVQLGMGRRLLTLQFDEKSPRLRIEEAKARRRLQATPRPR